MLYESRGRQELRNVREPVELVAAVRIGAAPRRQLAIDPVCHMAVDPDRAAGRLVYEGTTYFFCTLACAGDFARRPERLHLTLRLKRRRRSALATTEMLERTIARPAMTGLSSPIAASGIAATL